MTPLTGRKTSSNIPLHEDFLSLFDSLNITQLINAPIHYRGNILDILLSDIPSTISNIVIRGHNEHIKSDHYAMTFNLIFNKLISRRKGLNNSSTNDANWHHFLGPLCLAYERVMDQTNTGYSCTHNVLSIRYRFLK